MFRRYADDGATIADLARWLTSLGVPTRTGKHRWDRSVIWGMLRNPAYPGRAVFGKTQIIHEQPGLNRVARLQGWSTPRAVKAVDRPREEWTEIAVPAIVSEETFARAGQRLADNKRFASRNSKIPSLLGLAACSACGYAYYRGHTTTTAGNKIYYYRCLGSDDYRYQGGRVCGNKPVRADYLDTVVWDHITGLLADPALIRAEIDRRLTQARASDPVTRQRKQLELALAKAATSVTAMIEAYSEQLITIDELRAKMPHLRARQASLRSQIEALDAQAADRDAYLKLAGDLDSFLTQLRGSAATASGTVILTDPPPAAQFSAAMPEATVKRPAQVLQRPCRLEPRAGLCDALVGETHTAGGGPARLDARRGGAERCRPARAGAAGRSGRAARTGPARRAGRGAAAGGGGRDADGVGVGNPLPGGAAGLGAAGRAHARVPAAQRPVPVEPQSDVHRRGDRLGRLGPVLRQPRRLGRAGHRVRRLRHDRADRHQAGRRRKSITVDHDPTYR